MIKIKNGRIELRGTAVEIFSDAAKLVDAVCTLAREEYSDKAEQLLSPMKASIEGNPSFKVSYKTIDLTKLANIKEFFKDGD